MLSGRPKKSSVVPLSVSSEQDSSFSFKDSVASEAAEHPDFERRGKHALMRVRRVDRYGKIEAESAHENKRESSVPPEIQRLLMSTTRTHNFNKKKWTKRYQDEKEEQRFSHYYTRKYAGRLKWLCLLGVPYFAFQGLIYFDFTFGGFIFYLIPNIFVSLALIAVFFLRWKIDLFTRYYSKICAYVFSLIIISDLCGRSYSGVMSPVLSPMSYSMILLLIIRSDATIISQLSVLFVLIHISRAIIQGSATAAFKITAHYFLCVAMMVINLRSVDSKERKIFENDTVMRDMESKIKEHKDKSFHLLEHVIPRFFSKALSRNTTELSNETKSIYGYVICIECSLYKTNMSIQERAELLSEFLMLAKKSIDRCKWERIKTQGNAVYVLCQTSETEKYDGLGRLRAFGQRIIDEAKEISQQRLMVRIGISLNYSHFGIVKSSRIGFDGYGKGIQQASECCCKSAWGAVSWDSKLSGFLKSVPMNQSHGEVIGNGILNDEVVVGHDVCLTDARDSFAEYKELEMKKCTRYLTKWICYFEYQTVEEENKYLVHIQRNHHPHQTGVVLLFGLALCVSQGIVQYSAIIETGVDMPHHLDYILIFQMSVICPVLCLTSYTFFAFLGQSAESKAAFLPKICSFSVSIYLLMHGVKSYIFFLYEKNDALDQLYFSYYIYVEGIIIFTITSACWIIPLPFSMVLLSLYSLSNSFLWLGYGLQLQLLLKILSWFSFTVGPFILFTLYFYGTEISNRVEFISNNYVIQQISESEELARVAKENMIGVISEGLYEQLLQTNSSVVSFLNSCVVIHILHHGLISDNMDSVTSSFKDVSDFLLFVEDIGSQFGIKMHKVYVESCLLVFENQTSDGHSVSQAIKFSDHLLRQYSRILSEERKTELRICIGIGDVAMGIIGYEGFTYDIIGDVVYEVQELNKIGDFNAIQLSKGACRAISRQRGFVIRKKQSAMDERVCLRYVEMVADIWKVFQSYVTWVDFDSTEEAASHC